MTRRDLPTARPVGMPDEDAAADPLPPGVADIPWIDVHQHTQSLTWNDRNAFDLSGARATVMIAASYYWSPYRPVSAGDVRFLWDDALRRAAEFTRSHFYDQYVAVGIHTWSRVEGVEELLAVLPEYCELDEVVAVGETGIESTQHTSAWDLEGQKDAVREQMRVARDADLPILLHTPGSNKGGMPAWHANRYEEDDASFTDPVFAAADPKLEATEICIDLADEVGLPHERAVIDHASPGIAPYVMEETDCRLAFSVSAPWLRGIDAADVAGTIEEYGSERVLVDTDLAGPMRNDPFVVKETIHDLLRLGVDPDDVRRVVYENPRDLLGLNYPD